MIGLCFTIRSLKQERSTHSLRAIKETTEGLTRWSLREWRDGSRCSNGMEAFFKASRLSAGLLDCEGLKRPPQAPAGFFEGFYPGRPGQAIKPTEAAKKPRIKHPDRGQGGPKEPKQGPTPTGWFPGNGLVVDPALGATSRSTGIAGGSPPFQNPGIRFLADRATATASTDTTILQSAITIDNPKLRRTPSTQTKGRHVGE